MKLEIGAQVISMSEKHERKSERPAGFKVSNNKSSL